MSTKSVINYIEGDLFAAIKDKTCPIILPHVCNNQGAWGAGFVVPLGKHFPQSRLAYRAADSLDLGGVQYVKVENVLICNMIAQELGGKRPLYYNYLANAMTRVGCMLTPDCEVHAPAFGAGLAGGDWNVISALIEDCWQRPHPEVPINIYFLPGTFLPPE